MDFNVKIKNFNLMLQIGITGQDGFVGTHLYNTLNLSPTEFNCVDYNISFFSDKSQLDNFVSTM